MTMKTVPNKHGEKEDMVKVSPVVTCKYCNSPFSLTKEEMDGKKANCSKCGKDLEFTGRDSAEDRDYSTQHSYSSYSLFKDFYERSAKRCSAGEKAVDVAKSELESLRNYCKKVSLEDMQFMAQSLEIISEFLLFHHDGRYNQDCLIKAEEALNGALKTIQTYRAVYASNLRVPPVGG